MTPILLSLGEERGAWLGLASGGLAALLGAGAAAQSHAVYAAFGPQDLTAWVTAIGGAIGTLTAACNGVAILWHRWGKKPRKPAKRKGKPDAKLPAPPAP